MQFRKKPVVIEAEQYQVGGDLPFVEEDVLQYDEDSHRQYINTMEGKMWVSDGDWIIKGVKGEFYPCKPDIFEASVADTLREARRRIEEPEKWGKGVECFHGRECAGLAIDRAARELGLSYDSYEYNQAESLFQQVTKTHSIVCWNDSSKRTHAEVLAAFDRAIALAESAEEKNVMDVREYCLKQARLAQRRGASNQMIADAFAPTITKLVEAARNFAARVEERNPEWFREERGTTDFSEADHALRAALAELEKP